MDFTVLKTEQRKEQLRNEIGALEQQLWSRERDAAHWRAVREDAFAEAVGVDERILNNRDDEARSQLAGALYDMRKLDIKLSLTKAELAKLEASAPKPGRVTVKE